MSLLVCSLYYFVRVFSYILMIVFLLGTFLVNSFPAPFLFHLGTSRSFVSQLLNRGFDMNLRELECSLRVSITNEHKVSTLIIFQDYTL